MSNKAFTKSETDKIDQCLKYLHDDALLFNKARFEDVKINPEIDTAVVDSTIVTYANGEMLPVYQFADTETGEVYMVAVSYKARTVYTKIGNA